MEADESAAVVTLVCLTCGKEQYFAQDVPARIACTQCGGTVFRTFDPPTKPDDAANDALEAPARLTDDDDDDASVSASDADGTSAF